VGDGFPAPQNKQMTKKKKQKYPVGWDEERVRKLAEHYDNQTEDEHAAEIEAFEILGEALKRLQKSDPTLANQIPEHRQIISFRNVLIHVRAARKLLNERL
jgi:hypothetical protein